MVRRTTATTARIDISTVWERFIPHFCKPGKTSGRTAGIPDAGMRMRIGRNGLIARPAHVLHAGGHFQCDAPASRILFSGDLGVPLVGGQQAGEPVSHLAPGAAGGRSGGCVHRLGAWAAMRRRSGGPGQRPRAGLIHRAVPGPPVPSARCGATC